MSDGYETEINTETAKTATEVLAELLSDQKKLLGYFSTIDMNVKLILKKMSTLENNKSIQPVIQSIKAEAIELPLKNKGSGKSQLQIALEEQQDEENAMLEEGKSAVRRGARNPDSSIAKIPMQQKLVYSGSNKPIFLAKVQIFDENNALVKEVNTNNAGKIISALIPGNYRVVVKKSAAQNNPEIDTTYNINIPANQPLIKLEDRAL